MSPKESDSLLSDYSKTAYPIPKHVAAAAAAAAGGATFSADLFDRHLSLDSDNDKHGGGSLHEQMKKPWVVRMLIVASVVAILGLIGWMSNGSDDDDDANHSNSIHTLRSKISSFRNRQSSPPLPLGPKRQHNMNLTGPYQLVEVHYGQSFFDYYDFQDGPDSLGSAGYNVYVGRDRAKMLGLWNVTRDESDGTDYVYMTSAVGTGPRDEYGNRFRESIRLEGKRRFDRGLIVLDVAHMPAGCGVWPAFWTTDEAAWPDHGEIDIVEGINTQDVVKTALHTSQGCDMYAHTPRWEWTGEWDTATGIPDRFTGQLNFDSKLQADNCWTMTPHQWANQGCVAVSQENGTIGSAMNDVGGGVYVLEWDDANGYIKSWVFKNGHVPTSLQQSLDSANQQPTNGAGTDIKKTATKTKKDTSSSTSSSSSVVPDPSSWGVPYAYFAIGDNSGCPADHFQNHRLVINLAFCGTVAGNRFAQDCPALYNQYNVNNDSVLTCNAYIDSNPDSLIEAYWKIKGVYMYQRTEYKEEQMAK